MGRTPEQWRTQMRADTFNEWTQWWANNKDRYPASPLNPTALPNTPPEPLMKAKARS